MAQRFSRVPWPPLPAIAVALAASCFVGISPARYDEILTAKVAHRASFDLRCPAPQLSVVQLDDRNYGATGCGLRASYVRAGFVCSPKRGEEYIVDHCSVSPSGPIVHANPPEAAPAPAASAQPPTPPAPL